MRVRTCKGLLWAGVICAGVVAATVVHAQGYPTRPVRVIVPFSAGGAADTPGRMLASKLSEVLGQQIIIDNRPGAGSTIGTEVAA